jgi:hypothetical protein
VDNFLVLASGFTRWLEVTDEAFRQDLGLVSGFPTLLIFAGDLEPRVSATPISTGRFLTQP